MLTCLVLFLLRQTFALIPRLCIDNATQPQAECCPSIPGDAAAGACGGSVRGRCELVIPARNYSRDTAPLIAALDDRVDWPLRFFSRVCRCLGRWDGVSCERCQPGWRGSNCELLAPQRIRRNLMSLTPLERSRFQEVLKASKTVPSDFVVLNTSSNAHCDPITPQTMQPFNVSVFDTLVFVHFYSTRSTILLDVPSVSGDDAANSCNATSNQLNFAHRGPAFYPWHRYYMLLAERELGQIARSMFGDGVGGGDDWAMPYWDWVDDGNCSVCVDSMMGSVQQPGDTFPSWFPICDQQKLDEGCHICDPGALQPLLWRQYNNNRLPVQAELDHLMTLTQYDNAPYDQSTPSSTSFRNLGEGFLRYLTSPDKDQDLRRAFGNINETRSVLHNAVHNFLNGTAMDVATSPNDPIFFVHHAFVDKIFELWLQRNIVNGSLYPEEDEVRSGHGIDDFMVPFFPLKTPRELFRPSREFGYRYDNNYLGTSRVVVPTDAKPVGPDTNMAVILGVIGLLSVLVLLAMGSVLLIRRRGRTRSLSHTAIDEQQLSDDDNGGADEKRPLLHF